MSEINASIVKVKDVLKENLRIPEYQRPYRWDTENVRQLLEDILTSKTFGKKQYRIGSVILHDNSLDNTLDLVDGQQRVTTIFLIKKACLEEEILSCSLSYKHIDSFNNIKNNYAYIDSWLCENCKDDRADYFKYINESCEFVQIVVSDLSEAFQMFDSQNGRGKELEAYNLLKAYHIRAMELNGQDEKIKCDKQWEASTMWNTTPTIMGDAKGNIDILKQLFSEQIYRSRIWSKKESAYRFTKKEIHEFKGFTIDKNHLAQFPYQNPQLLQYLTSKFYKNVLEGTVSTQTRFISGDGENIDPFVSINQNIVNGKPFFDFIETYVEIYKRMFIDLGSFQLAEFKGFFYKYCLEYGADENKRFDTYAFYPKGYSASRDGDSHLRELYKSLVFVLFDKFGEKGLNKYYKVIYRLIYLNRLANKQVKYNMVANLPHEYFDIIIQAKDLAELVRFQQLLEKEKEDKNLDYFSNIDQSVINFIKEGK